MKYKKIAGFLVAALILTGLTALPSNAQTSELMRLLANKVRPVVATWGLNASGSSALASTTIYGDLTDPGGNKYSTSTVGGASAAPTGTLLFTLSLGDAAVASATFPNFNRVMGANVIYNVITYNSTTTQSATWSQLMPPVLGTVTSGTLAITWTSAGVGTASTSVFTVDYRCASSTATIDASTNPATVHASGTPVQQGTASTYALSLIPLATSTFLPNSSCDIKVTLDTSTSSIRADVNVKDIMLTITR